MQSQTQIHQGPVSIEFPAGNPEGVVVISYTPVVYTYDQNGCIMDQQAQRIKSKQGL